MDPGSKSDREAPTHRDPDLALCRPSQRALRSGRVLCSRQHWGCLGLVELGRARGRGGGGGSGEGGGGGGGSSRSVSSVQSFSWLTCFRWLTLLFPCRLLRALRGRMMVGEGGTVGWWWWWWWWWRGWGCRESSFLSAVFSSRTCFRRKRRKGPRKKNGGRG